MMQEERYAMEEFQALNTSITAVLPSEPSPKRDDSRWIREWFAYVEQTFSRFLRASELSRLNRSDGRPMLVSANMLEVLQLCRYFIRKTGGIFNPFVLQALMRAGYTDSFERLQREPAGHNPFGEQPPYGGQAGMNSLDARDEDWALDEGMGAVKLPQSGGLDLGGIVKGWAVDRMTARLRDSGVTAGMLDAGGDLAVWGGTPDSPWPIEVADPFCPEQSIAVVNLIYGAAATSSRMKRRWRTVRGEMHHLIDPRTMLPGDSDIVQCTVIGQDVSACEVYAKTVLLLGSEAGEIWLRSAGLAPAYQFLIVTERGERRYIGTSQQYNAQWKGFEGKLAFVTL
ncbi:FAD:protein FMN transferase [Paenibacillus sp. y28]|uniref:FAD:protein FMN transferase n=1 Tax=Paenibacillus sp. y28 TaxID=3129110 RepID=UPI0030190A6C